jgi:hypothetical protein
MEEIGELMFLFGALLLLGGMVFLLIGRISGLGRLPGDFVFQSQGLACLFPLATSILLSIVLTVVLNLIIHLFDR